MFSIGIMGACTDNVANNSNVDNSSVEDESSTEIKKTVTLEEAIILAKKDSTIQNKLAQRFDLVFYAPPSWGLCDGKIDTEQVTPCYKLTLMGTISGYTDSYKTDLSYGNKFKIVAWVSIYGEVAPNIVFLST